MLDEIREIPERARDCMRRNADIRLPVNVPYMGMGSSYYAAIALKYAGAPILPEIASEYAYYLSGKRNPQAVLISQSGHSSETLWASNAFESYVAVVNDPASPLAANSNCREVINLAAGEEVYSSTKTYVNTLVALYAGLGFNPQTAVEMTGPSMDAFDDWGRATAESVLSKLNASPQRGIIVLGSGPNFASAQQSALVLTETMHRPVQALTLAQFDHGPKESAENSIVLTINADGPVRRRTRALVDRIREHGAAVWEWDQNDIPENLSPILSCIPFFYLAAYLSELMGIRETFRLGGKITGIADQ